jgi:hypothetical protein
MLKKAGVVKQLRLFSLIMSLNFPDNTQMFASKRKSRILAGIEKTTT